jgi:hypothetical protein
MFNNGFNNGIEILWSDLTKEAQKRIGNALIEAGQEDKEGIEYFNKEKNVPIGWV